MSPTNSIASTPVDGDDDTTTATTPLASQAPSLAPVESSAPSASFPSPSASETNHNTTNRFLLPIPTPSSNPSTASFVLPDMLGDEIHAGFDQLPPEIASADISISPDGSFVETSSGAAAMELKRRYDHMYGVNRDVRSPYAITAFVNQHGRQMFRVGRRDLSAPGASAVEAEQRMSQQVQNQSPSAEATRTNSSTRRRSRVSVSQFLPPSMRNGSNNSNPTTNNGGTRSPPNANASGSHRKLRKTRSIPGMYTGMAFPLASSTSGQGPHPAGRTHSHSVTAADVLRAAAEATTIGSTSVSPGTADVSQYFPPVQKGDMFSAVMEWEASGPLVPSSPWGSSSSKSLQLSDSEFAQLGPPMMGGGGRTEEGERRVISSPFGVGVGFDSPSRKSGTGGRAEGEGLRAEPVLREMQSFESGLTARADPPGLEKGKGKAPQLETEEEETPEDLRSSSPGSSPSPPPRSVSPVESVKDKDKDKDTSLTPSWETSLFSRYSTDVFDVLQTYRGLPRLDMLDAMETTVIKMSLQADETAAPRNDPRFVIWGEIQSVVPEDNRSFDGQTESSQQSEVGRRKSVKVNRDRRGTNPGQGGGEQQAKSTPSLSVQTEGQKVLVAATIERWIAQLTSELNYDELLIFFLTYRTYVSAVDLCQLLICRFHWSLALGSKGSHDEMVRRIVRVRTFVAMRYWLLTFFPFDFLPNRDLRVLFANWLNVLWRDPILKKQRDAMSIVRKLRQVVKDCKDAHIRKERTTTTATSNCRSPGTKPKQFPKPGQSLGDLSNSQKFAESLRKAVGDVDQDDSDIDLDFWPEEGVPTSVLGFPNISSPDDGAPSVGANAHLETQTRARSSSSVPSASRALLQQPLHLTILRHANTATDTPFVQTPATLPVHHSSLSRVLVKTMGRLGRWKRVLNQRSSMSSALSSSGDVSAFDLEINATGDLLTVRGGMEQYLKMIEQPPAASDTSASAGSYASPDSAQQNAAASLTSPSQTITEEDENESGQRPSGHLKSVTEGSEEDEDAASQVHSGESEQEKMASSSSDEEVNPAPAFAGNIRDSAYTYDSALSCDESDDARSQHRPPPGLDVVSIDDLDLSDMSSSEDGDIPVAPPGLRRVQRKLPLRRDFEFVRRSDSVSSMGIGSHSSLASERSSAAGSDGSETGPTLGANIHQWQINAIVDSLSDDEERGDIEAALRRLEGQINTEQVRNKQKKVDGWVRTMRRRMVNGDYYDEPPRYPTSDSESNDEDLSDRAESERGSASWCGHDGDAAGSSRSQSPRSSQVSEEHRTIDEAVSGGDCVPGVPPGLANSASTSDHRPAPEDAVPIEILQSRVPSRPSTSHGSPPQTSPSANFNPTSSSPRYVSPSNGRAYRSFVLGFRAEVLVQHFSMIDREIFLAIKFEELLSEDWMGYPEEVNVLDWSQFLKDRARWKAESRGGPKMNAIVAARGRFNLVANFVVSEVIMTPPTDRAPLVAKFIRIAWKAYCQNNFNTLTAIIAGLQNVLLRKAVRRFWGRIGMWEQRMFQDLQQFITSEDDFKHIRTTVSALVESKSTANEAGMNGGMADGQPPMAKTRPVSESKPQPPTSCVPFFGIYLSQMLRHSKLPDLIDPTAPNEAVGIDPVTGNFEAPAHPEVFDALAPLPPSMQLEPLINVHKQRLIAGVVKSLVAGQHLASRVQFPTDKKIFQRCLKLRALDQETLHRMCMTSE